MTNTSDIRKVLKKKKDTTILVVEDDEAVLSMYSISLSKIFKRVISVEDGQIAWERFQKELEDGNEIPVVITDALMPKMDGIELTMNIHKIQPATQILIISGYHKSSISFHSLIENVTYLPKPIEITLVEMAVMQAYRTYPQAVWIEKLKAEVQNESYDEDAVARIIRDTPWLKV
jgi:response regulator RpfG family c-di-GMP phosphodiesterase